MALIKRQKPNDSIKKFEMTPGHKYQAGLTLIENGDGGTGVEQLGYAAEMLLKSAYFRFMKVPDRSEKRCQHHHRRNASRRRA